LSDIIILVKEEINMPSKHKKIDSLIETSLVVIFLVLAAILFLYQVIPGHIRYWVIVGFTIAYFVLLLTKLAWDRVKSR
jgi:Ca2+/Na+ antiporter